MVSAHINSLQSSQCNISRPHHGRCLSTACTARSNMQNFSQLAICMCVPKQRSVGHIKPSNDLWISCWSLILLLRDLRCFALGSYARLLIFMCTEGLLAKLGPIKHTCCPSTTMKVHNHRWGIIALVLWHVPPDRHFPRPASGLCVQHCLHIKDLGSPT
jgi:hypothetical protein